MWEVIDDVEEASSSPSLTMLRNDKRPVSVILVDGSARTQLHINTITEDILRTKVALTYGDYPPSSLHVVETVYMGGEFDALLAALRDWSFAGGTPIRNALHEGFASVMDIIRNLVPKDEPCSVTVVGCTLYYEEFQTSVEVQSIAYRDRTLEEMIVELKMRGKARLSCYWPFQAIGRTFLNLLGKIYTGDELRSIDALPAGWVGRTTEVKPSALSVRSSISGESINLEGSIDGIDIQPSNTLEQTVRQFLAAVLKMPQTHRADAIKRHLESPAFSTEYKQCLVAMVRQMQNAAKNVRKTQPPPVMKPVKPVLPAGQRIAPVQNPPSRAPPIWRGRVAFRTNAETFFDAIAVPISNPKGTAPQSIPLATDYSLDAWPLVLAVASFVSVQSPAVSKSVSVSKLVELIAINPDGIPAMGNEAFIGFRNLLATRQLVGLVRLGASHAMLIATRPHQLVGMVLSRQAAAAMATPMPEPTKPLVIHPIEPQPQSRPTRNSRVLTPDAILRQHKSAPETVQAVPTHSPTQSLDVFNALMGSQAMDFDAAEGNIVDFCDLAFPDVPSEMHNSFFDLPP